MAQVHRLSLTVGKRRFGDEDLRASIATSRLVVLPGAGHVCNIEASEQFNREVRNFLRSYQR